MVCILNESEKIARTEHTRANLLSIKPRANNIDQTAGHPIEEIGGCTLEKDERSAAIADNRGLFEQLIDHALGNSARSQPMLELLESLACGIPPAGSSIMAQLNNLSGTSVLS